MLAPEAQKFLDRLKRRKAKSMSEQTPLEARAYVAAQAKLGHKKHFADLKVTDIILTHHPAELKLPEVNTPLRFYRPNASDRPALILYFHGGGFVAGNADYVDSLCQHLAEWSQALVISVDYHLAPEYRFPFAIYEGLSVLKTLFAHAHEYRFNRDQVTLMGDSAGGNLAAVITRLAVKEHNIPLYAQVLLYPDSNFMGDYPSHHQFASGYFLSRKDSQWAEKHYLGEMAHAKDPRASPLLAKDLLGLPKTLIITAQCDPLRDEGRAYAARLIEFGNEVYYHEYAGMIHCFITFFDFFPENAGKALTEVCNFLKICYSMHA